VGFNVWWCYDLGRAIEGRWGHLTLLVLVVGGGFAASAVQWMVEGGGVGLSGVLYALAGFLFALRRVDPVAAAVMNPRIANTLIVWFVVCIVLTKTGSLAVANWAHGGGAVWGYLAGLALRVRWRRLAVPVLLLATAGLVAATPYVAFGAQARHRRTWKLLTATRTTRVSDTVSPHERADAAPALPREGCKRV
jgi:GlpG protein